MRQGVRPFSALDRPAPGPRAARSQRPRGRPGRPLRRGHGSAPRRL